MAHILRRIHRARRRRLGGVRAPEVLRQHHHPHAEVVDLGLAQADLLELGGEVTALRVAADVVVDRPVRHVATRPDPVVPRAIVRAEGEVVVVRAERPRLVRERHVAELVHARHPGALARVPRGAHVAIGVGDDALLRGTVRLLVREAALLDLVLLTSRVAKPVRAPDDLLPGYLEVLVFVHDLAIFGVVPVRHGHFGVDRLHRELELVGQRGVLREEAHTVVEHVRVALASGRKVGAHKVAQAAVVAAVHRLAVRSVVVVHGFERVKELLLLVV
mmetsp:Transcript_6548/g.13385  ORF Transcript_6548/g.13385 Transcript_6548/m.13385 type:complete len:275 (-) Transcript_6548:389-1213(-)